MPSGIAELGAIDHMATHAVLTGEQSIPKSRALQMWFGWRWQRVRNEAWDLCNICILVRPVIPMYIDK